MANNRTVTTSALTKQITKEQLKQLKAPIKNYIVITIDYSNSFVFPYKDGIKFIEAFEAAEEYEEVGSSNETHIRPLRKKAFSYYVIEESVYIEFKGNYLLDPNGDKPPF